MRPARSSEEARWAQRAWLKGDNGWGVAKRRRGSEFSALADFGNLAVAGFSVAKFACYLVLPMSNHSEIEEILSQSAIHKTIGAAIGTVLVLVAIATALIIAAVYPALNGHVIAVTTGMGIVVIALVVTIASVVLPRGGLPSNNDAWIFW